MLSDSSESYAKLVMISYIGSRKIHSRLNFLISYIFSHATLFLVFRQVSALLGDMLRPTSSMHH